MSACYCGQSDPAHERVDCPARFAGPRPNPSAGAREWRESTVPTVAVVPDLAGVLGDLRHLVKQGVDALKLKSGQFTPNDGKTLESLARTAKLVQDMDRTTKGDLSGKLDGLNERELRALLADPAALAKFLDAEDGK